MPAPKLPPLPAIHLLQSASSSAGASASRPQAFSNPVYPLFKPPHHSTHLNGPIATKSDDDVELLRQYGLDKFNLNDGHAQSNGKAGASNSQYYLQNANPKSRPIESTANNSRGSSPWTTFD